MSKLPNAPLLEVIFELRWQIKDKDDLQNYQYLIGDLYSAFKAQYPSREPLFPPGIPPDAFINAPAHRYRSESDGYPLIQVGPGVLTLNTTDESYDWPQFYGWSHDLVSKFLEIFPMNKQLFNTNLIYIDFFPFEFSKYDVLAYVNENFNVNISQSFLDRPGNPFHLDVGFFYETGIGNYSLTLKKGKNSQGLDGIVMQSLIKNRSAVEKQQEIMDWLHHAHEFSSSNFKNITQGSLYQSFN